ncbi:MAG: hypothetical protein KatS3mg115_1952 [Candidatus Poribacteria bacterium]|nr:MAG: hypothetical protein KatS3mg115_1952 [Candidatus Poribacteria bacterium]
MSERWLSITEAFQEVERLYQRHGRRISRKTISRWAQRGWVVAERRGARWYIEPHSLRQRALEELNKRSPLAAPSPDLSEDQPLTDPIERLRRIVEAMNAEFLRRIEEGTD